MEDERNAPQDQDEVEAHRLARDPSDALRHGAEQAVDEDDDEVEAHARRQAHAWDPEGRRE